MFSGQIPLHYVVDNHQNNNAAVLQKAGASRVLEDIGLTPGKLEAAINEMLGMVSSPIVLRLWFTSILFSIKTLHS